MASLPISKKQVRRLFFSNGRIRMLSFLKKWHARLLSLSLSLSGLAKFKFIQ
ncbi:MAG: hypothetical protein LBT02_00155 [Rickettsiales bacterium]|nr:hypothetical protein [Rickettsiales bacterium]